MNTEKDIMELSDEELEVVVGGVILKDVLDYLLKINVRGPEIDRMIIAINDKRFATANQALLKLLKRRPELVDEIKRFY